MDYTLKLDHERLSYILRDPKYPQYHPETIANYILNGKKQYPKKDDQLAPLSPDSTANTTRYTAPRPLIPWHHPELSTLSQSRNQLSTLIQAYLSTPAEHLPKYTNPADYGPHNISQHTALLKRVKTELSQNAGPILAAYNPTTHFFPTPSLPTPIDISLHVDYTNSFHIKQMLLHYSALRQSPESKWDIYYLDHLIDNTPLSNWQLHLLVRRIDGYNQITTAREIAQIYNKILSPGTMSETMRTIYKAIAKTAQAQAQAYADRNNPAAWKYCAACNQNVHLSQWYTKRKYCKACEKIRRKRKEAQTNGTATTTNIQQV